MTEKKANARRIFMLLGDNARALLERFLKLTEDGEQKESEDGVLKEIE